MLKVLIKHESAVGLASLDGVLFTLLETTTFCTDNLLQYLEN